MSWMIGFKLNANSDLRSGMRGRVNEDDRLEKNLSSSCSDASKVCQADYIQSPESLAEASWDWQLFSKLCEAE